MRYVRVMAFMGLMVAFLAASSADGTVWRSDFSDFEGEGADAQIGIDPPDPDAFWGEAWNADDVQLRQGSGPWGPTMFYAGSGVTSAIHAPTDGLDTDDGAGLSFRVRVSDDTPPMRGGIQFSAQSSSSETTFGSTIMFYHDEEDETSYIVMVNNKNEWHDRFDDVREVELYDIGDARGEFVTITAEMVYVPEDNTEYNSVSHGDDDRWTYVKLWVDGELALFGGPSGSPEHPETGEQYSFRAAACDNNSGRVRFGGAVSFSGVPAGLGESWEFEYDYISWTDNPDRFDELEPVEPVEEWPSPSAFVSPGGSTTLGPVLLHAEYEADATFRWYHNDVLIDGATEPGLFIDNATEADAGTYTVVVSHPDFDDLEFEIAVRVAEVGLPAAGMAGLLAVGGLIALAGTARTRRKRQ